MSTIKEILIEKRIRELEQGIKKSTDIKSRETNHGKIIYLKSEKQRLTKELKDKVKVFSQYTRKIIDAKQELAKKETEFKNVQLQSKSNDTKLTDKIKEIGQKRNTMSSEELMSSEESDITSIQFIQNEKKADLQIVNDKQQQVREAKRFVNEKIAQKDADKLLIKALETTLQ